MKIKALKFFQGNNYFFVGHIKSKVLIEMSKVDEYNPTSNEGYQRIPKRNRSVDFSKFMKSGLSPPSLVVNIREKDDLKYEDDNIIISDDTILWIVDGQHRMFGLEMLNKTDPEILEKIDMPIIILHMNELEEAKQFKIINSMQKNVPTDLADRVILKISKNECLDKSQGQAWVGDYLWRSLAVEVVDHLVNNANSVWHHKIKLPNQKNKNSTISQTGFLLSMKHLIKDGYFMGETIPNIVNVLNNYWEAISDINPKLFEHDSKSVIQKGVGTYILHGLLQRILILLSQKKTDVLKGDFLHYLNKLPSLKDTDEWISPNGSFALLAGVKGLEYGKNILLNELNDNINN